VGGLDAIDASLVAHFDYVALGHIHGAQQVLSEHIRYCGTPLKYSVSEEYHKKSITLVTLEEKGSCPCIETIPLKPSQEVRRERGTLAEILSRATPENENDFLSVTLTDEKEPYHPREQLEEKYHYLLELRMDNQRTRALLDFSEEPEEELSPLEVFAGFYQEMQGQTISPQEESLLREVLEHLGQPEGKEAL
jgi:exonuclease SbcD